MTVDRTSQHLRQTALPFPYRGDGLRFDIDVATIDGGEETAIDARRTKRQWTIPSDDWQRCTLSGTLDLPADVVEAVFPPEEREGSPGSLYVALRCRETILRDRVVVRDAPLSPDSYEFSIELDRSDLRGEVELRPFLTRTSSGSVDGASYATAKNARLASASPWTVIVDGTPSEDGEVGIGVRVERFSTTPRLPDSGLYYLDLGDPSDPVVVVNGDHRRIVGVLQSEGSVGAEARMRDVVFDEIQYAVWSQLILHAGAAVDRNGNPQYDWQQTVLKIFVRDLYGSDDTAAASRRLNRDLNDPTQIPHVMARIDRVLQRYLDNREQLINLMEEGLQI